MSSSLITEFYLKQVEPTKSCMLALKDIILSSNEDLREDWKYGLPFFCYYNKMVCYIWKDKKTDWPYIGIVEGNQIDHPFLIKGDRKRMKVFTVNPNEDIPIEALNQVLNKMMELYTSGKVKVKK